ncbi:sulfatase-like hydrolase/transferase [Planctomycetes bacterium CA13]
MKNNYAAIAFFLILSAVQARAGEKTNFVFFLSDDQLKADYGCYGLPVDLTPTVGRLAHEGLVFDKMFAAEAICAPSRTALLTGLYPIRNGLFVQHASARSGTQTIYDALTPLDYDVSRVGKVHVKPDSVFRWSTPIRPTKKKLPADDIDAYFSSHADKPFCLFIMSHYPHRP